METTTNITPPPFNPKQDVEVENPSQKSETNDLDALGLDAQTQSKIAEMLKDAETQGYLRGRNEKIEATQHFDQNPELEPHPVGIPLYNRHSIWDP